ncbi:nucleobase-ascorbate transporter [Trifolium repens]|nr:nucleobase-ascorbate transporter [Trifolium repens]
MENGSNSKSFNKSVFVSKSDRSPRDLGSWAERTGFVCDYSAEAGSSGSEKFELFQERGRWSSSSPQIEIDHVSGRSIRQNRDAWCCCWFMCLGNRNVKPVYLINEKS